MNIYEQALGNLTEQNWAKNKLFDNDGNRCLAGHLMYAQYGRYVHWSELPDLNVEDFALVLHKIIAGQYPEVVDRWLGWLGDQEEEASILTPIGLVTFFNDDCASYSDIRTVLEKASANEQA